MKKNGQFGWKETTEMRWLLAVGGNNKVYRKPRLGKTFIFLSSY